MADPIAQAMTDEAEMAQMDPDKEIPANELYDLMRQQRFSNLKRRAAVLLQFFKDNGIAKAVVEYSGSGDSGNGMFAKVIMADGTERDDQDELHEEFVVKDVPTRASSWNRADQTWEETTTTKDEALPELLCDMADGFVDIYHGGYENNEGGEGEVIFTLDGVLVNHADFIVERVASPREFYPVSIL